MVHALEEIHRVLIPQGILIDLRPITGYERVEVCSGRDCLHIGHPTDLPDGFEIDRKAALAFRKAAQRGWFIRQSRQVFPFYYYWDSPEEMQEHVREKWSDTCIVEPSLFTAVQKTWAAASPGAKVRMRLRMHLTGWQRSDLD